MLENEVISIGIGEIGGVLTKRFLQSVLVVGEVAENG
jgi:hypothetical protein